MVAHGLGMAAQIGAGQGGHVAGRGALARCGQARGVLEDRPGHAELACLVVHEVGEVAAVAADMLGYGHGGVIARSHGHTGKELVHGDSLAGTQTHAGTAHPGRRMDTDAGVAFQAAHFDAVHDHIHGHDLGQRGGRDGQIGVVLVQHLAVAQVDHDGSAGPAGRIGTGRQREHGKDKQQDAQPAPRDGGGVEHELQAIWW